MVVAIHARVWTIDLTGSWPLWFLDATLDTEETALAAKYRFPPDRMAFISRRAAYRVLLGRELGVAPWDVRYRRTGTGKPELDHPRSPKFSTSRSATRALLAVAPCDVGVDIERGVPVEDLRALAGAAMTPSEYADWRSLDPSRQRPSFYRAWVRKEAVVKAAAFGLTTNLHELDVRSDRTALAGKDWWLTDLDAPEGFFANLALGEPLPIMHSTWSWDDDCALGT